MKGKRVFVSGGAGVIGRALVPMLVDSGAIVMVGDLESVPVNYPSNIIYRCGDLNNLTQNEINYFDPEIFIHLAATFERSEETYGHWEENFNDNLLLSHHLINLLRNAPSLKRVVNASSYLIYDKSLYMFPSHQNQPRRLKETDPINPRNLTGMSKLNHEIELDFLSKFTSEKFSSVSARIYRGYGKNSRDIISRWVRALINNEEIVIYNEESFFDYMYAEETALGLIKLCNSKAKGVINLGTGKARRVKDVIDILNIHFPEMKYKKVNYDDELFEASEADTNLLEETVGWIPEGNLEENIKKIIDFENQQKNYKKQNFGNILITSCSSKIGLIESVFSGVSKINRDIKIIGGDSSPEVIGSHFVDDFWEMPMLDTLTPQKFIKHCKNLNITTLIASRDSELGYFSKFKDLFQAEGIHIMISSENSVNNCIDKLKFSQLKELCIIPSSLSIDDIDANRFVVKERFGAGSKSIGIDLDYSEAKKHAISLESPIFQPFIQGKELSVDAYISSKKIIKGIVMRKRVLVKNGESQITKTHIDKNLEKQFSLIIDSLKLYGHIILQAIIDNNNEIHVIECNPRFGGASTLSVHLGLDSFYWFYLESIGKDITDYSFIRPSKEITQIRYKQDLIK